MRRKPGEQTMTSDKTRIDWVGSSCRLLQRNRRRVPARHRPFEGLTIGTGIHLEPKTVALLTTLAAGRRPPGLHRQPQQHPAGDGRVPAR
jgi:S-adenosylhomocysteine hydrolase